MAIAARRKDPTEQTVLATCAFADIVRGAFQACHLGYGLAASMQGQGLMREVLEAVSPGHSANCACTGSWQLFAAQERSARLLASLGFEREGYAKRYLQIAGKWEDHILTALICPGG